MHDTDLKKLLPIHIILGWSNFTKIKMGAYPRVGQVSKIFAEQTKIGWVVMSPGGERDNECSVH